MINLKKICGCFTIILIGTCLQNVRADQVASFPSLSFAVIDSTARELHKRFIYLQNNEKEKDNSVWAYGYGKELNIHNNIRADVLLGGAEAGYDHKVYSKNGDHIFVGFTGGHLYSGDAKSHQNAGVRGIADITVPYFGIYGAWMNNGGWFANASARAFIINMATNLIDTIGDVTEFDYKRKYLASVMEFGRKLSYEMDAFSRLTMDMVGSFQYLYSGSRSTKVVSVGNLEDDPTQGIRTGVYGIFAYESISMKADFVSRPFVRVGIAHEFDGVTDTRYSIANYQNDFGGYRVELGAGYELKLSGNKHLIFDIMYENGEFIDNFSTSFGGRYSF